MDSICPFTLLFTRLCSAGCFRAHSARKPGVHGAKLRFLPFLCLAKRVVRPYILFFSVIAQRLLMEVLGRYITVDYRSSKRQYLSLGKF